MLGQIMTEYAIIVALIAISGISAFRYLGGVQRSQMAAITQELAGQDSGDMLDLAQNYAGKARNDASRDKGLGDYYAGGGSSGGGAGSGGGTGSGGWLPPIGGGGGGGGGWTPPGGGILPPPGGGGGSCPASAEQKASGTMYVWAASDAKADCTEPKPLVKAVYLSDKLSFIKAAVESFDILTMFESYFPEGKTITFKVDNSIPGSMQVKSTDPDTILVNVDRLTGPDNLLEARHFASFVGHEIVHVYDINYRKKLGLKIDSRSRWQSEINATNWQVDNFAALGIARRERGDINDQFIKETLAYQRKAQSCFMTPLAEDCL
uniref:Integral membrane protein n=1 Tax=Rheinheimera sp. BAL341 TaxID=1708203 RepID=A0A486XHB6_9GAMM